MKGLANPPTGFTFSQLVRRDAGNAETESKRILEGRATRKVSVAQMLRTARRLKFVPIKVHGQAAAALLDSGAVPNVMSLDLNQLFKAKHASVSLRERLSIVEVYA